MRSKKRHPILKRILIITVVFFLTFLSLNLLFPIKNQKDFSQIVESDDGQIIDAFLTEDDKWRMFTRLEEITPNLSKAIIAKEDKYFYFHPGINPAAIIRAVFNNLTQQKRTSGASTITMQVARLLEPKPRTIGSKLFEMFRALQLEWKYSKKEILQLYLNLIPFGSNIEGVKAAAYLYLDKHPEQLSIGEIVALIIIPNRPSSLQLGYNNDYIIQERNKWLKRFEEENVFKTVSVQDAMEEPLLAKRQSIKKIAPHYALKMKKEYDDPIIESALNLEIQNAVNDIALKHNRRHQFKGIHNLSILVISNKTNQVVGYIGSPNFNDNDHSGQVDGITATRAPGSTLKPLIYGLAIDNGIITPQTIVTDVPIDFSGYAPKNYDETYRGKVSIATALELSLNVPAVKVLERLKTNNAIDVLIKANFKSIQTNKDQLGLSLALGGCGVSLLELTQLYASFANEGKWKDLNWLSKDVNKKNEKRLVSKQSAFIITDILDNITRPDLPKKFSNAINLPKIAWKTGTSYGRRDAWSIGYNKNFTIGVWAGNFNGVGVQELTGSDIATPLLIDIFNAIDYQDKNWFKMPSGVELRYVCSETGAIPDTFCNHQVLDYYIPAISSNKICKHLKVHYTSLDETISYCTTCLPKDHSYKSKLFSNYPGDLISYFQSENIPYQKVPDHFENCERIFSENSPQITSPSADLTYFIDTTDTQQIMLTSNTHNDVNRVYWYVNNEHVATVTKQESAFFVPKDLGRTKISCTDDKGRNNDIFITIKPL